MSASPHGRPTDPGAPAEPSPADAPVAAPDEEFAGNRRTLAGPWRAVFMAGAVGFALFHLVVLNFFAIDHLVFRSVHVAWGAVLVFVSYAARTGERPGRVPWFDVLLMLAAVGCPLYIAAELDGLTFRAGAMYTPGDVVMGAAGTLVVLEMTRRSAGLALALIAVAFLLYALAGPWMPGVLHHRGISLPQLLTYVMSDQGVFGVTTQVSSTYIVLFVAFAAFLQVSKVGDYINDLSMALVGWARGGPAKAAVLSGIGVGTISGSSVGNVVASGMVTIPMMRRVGYDRATAGAIEATSSTGGQITPPVMGAGAFIMAEVTGIPYADIAWAAIVPALLFYVACWAHVDINALRNGLHGIARDQLPALGLMLRRLYLFAPIAVLVWAMLAGYSIFRAGSLGIVAAVVVSWLAREHAVGPRRAIEALERTAVDALQLVAACACAGIIVGVIALTGIGGRFSAMVLALAGQSTLLAMLFAALIALILGMGMPTTAAYAIAASVVAPGVIRMGVEPLVAHLFIFYFAVLSAITPPVALASFAAASLAQADPWKTSWVALRFALATFLVPFMFFYSPVLLMRGDALPIVHATVTACVGVWLLAASTEGWFRGRLAPLPRAVLFASAIALIHPGSITDLMGLAGAAAVWALQRLKAPRAA